jgi:hypothetical protein
MSFSSAQDHIFFSPLSSIRPLGPAIAHLTSHTHHHTTQARGRGGGGSTKGSERMKTVGGSPNLWVVSGYVNDIQDDITLLNLISFKLS